MKALFYALFLGVTMLILANKTHATAYNKTSLHIRLPYIDELPFSKDAPIDTISAVITPILGQLVYTSNTFNLKPGLLESFHWDFKKSSYILKLKPNLKFHNGREVTSKDLEFSLLRGFYSSKQSFFLAFLNNIQGVESIKGKKKFKSGQVSGLSILDKRTLQLKLKKPNPLFIHSLTSAYFSVVPMESFKVGDYETWKSYPIGAGAYKVSQFKPNEGILTLQKVEKSDSSPDEMVFYYKKSNHPFDIEISSYSDESHGRKIVSSKKASSVTGIYFNYNNPVANDVRFRQALDLAINRESLTQGVEIYNPVNEFLASHFWGRVEPKTKIDIEKAKNLLKQVKKLDLSETYQIPLFAHKKFDNPKYRAKYGAYILELERQLKSIGLKIKIVISNKKIFPIDDKSTLFRLFSLGADIADSTILFGLLKGEKSPLRPHFPMNDKTYDALFKKAQQATIMEKRIESVKKLSEYLCQNKWMIPLFEKKLLVSINPQKVKDVGLQDGGLTFFVERVTLN